MEQELKDYLRELVYGALNDSGRDNCKKVLLSRDVTAKRLDVDPSTLWRWEKAGYLRPIRIGRSVYYRLEDVEARERGETTCDNLL